MQFDWSYFVTKLTSRKFWAALTGFITAILIMARVPDDTIAQIVALIGAFSVLIAYIIGEGLVDAAAASAPVFRTYSLDDVKEWIEE